jgi:hypothetical protein
MSGNISLILPEEFTPGSINFFVDGGTSMSRAEEILKEIVKKDGKHAVLRTSGRPGAGMHRMKVDAAFIEGVRKFVAEAGAIVEALPPEAPVEAPVEAAPVEEVKV